MRKVLLFSSKRSIFLVFFYLCSISFICSFFLRTSKWYWKGSTNLSISFLVEDSSSYQPIQGASINVLVNDGWYNKSLSNINFTNQTGIEIHNSTFTINSDTNGIAQYTCLDTLVTGRFLLFGICPIERDVCLPDWSVLVNAPDYQNTDLFQLSNSKFKSKIHHFWFQRDSLTIVIRLVKK